MRCLSSVLLGERLFYCFGQGGDVFLLIFSVGTVRFELFAGSQRSPAAAVAQEG